MMRDLQSSGTASLHGQVCIYMLAWLSGLLQQYCYFHLKGNLLEEAAVTAGLNSIPKAVKPDLRSRPGL